MRILSIDVGIKNLAFCLFEKDNSENNFKIKKWDTIDISENKDTSKCCFLDKNIICNNVAKFKKDEDCFCLKHSKKQQLQIPTSEQKTSFFNKQKIQKLYEIADIHNIKYDTKIKKNCLIKLICDYVKNHYLETIESKKANDVDLFNIGLNIKTKFNKLFEFEEQIDFVIIENQISRIATRMKTIQGMIVQYFIMSNIKVNYIEFISASNKLKDYNTDDKKNYSDRKKLGITKCLEFISTDFRFNEHLDFFNNHKKKDDLADSFLQGIWFINNKKL
jgi:hypothetical protein